MSTRLYSVFLLGLVFIVQISIAGTLEDFEKDATKDPAKRRARDPYTGRSPFEEPSYGPEPTPLRFPSRVPYPHQLGDPVKPFLRIDGAYQTINSRIDAVDAYVQTGYEVIGLDYRFTRYDEKNPSDTLNVHRGHVLMRTSFNWNPKEPKSFLQGFYGFGFGFGVLSLEREKTNSGLSFTMPVLFYPYRFLGLEFRPAWAKIKENTIQDYDLSLHLFHKVVSFKVGYRWLLSPNMELEGPYAGLALRF